MSNAWILTAVISGAVILTGFLRFAFQAYQWIMTNWVRPIKKPLENTAENVARLRKRYVRRGLMSRSFANGCGPLLNDEGKIVGLDYGFGIDHGLDRYK